MRNTWLVALVAVVATMSAEANSYLPNRATDRYTYHNVRFDSDSTSRVDTTSADWQHWTNFGGLGATWVWTSDANQQVFVRDGNRNVLFADFAASEGTTWNVSTQFPLPRQVTLARRGVVVRTPAGTWKNCITLEMSSNAMDAGVTSMTFAPGIGIVQSYSTSIAGPVRLVLVRGSIGGTSYPRPARAAISVNAWTDQAEYWIDTAQVGASGSTKATASMTIRNQTSENMYFDFHFGAQFDIEVINDSGTVVSFWTRGRYFSQMAWRMTLAPGQSVNYNGEVELTDDRGRNLPAGNYTIKIHTNSAQLVEATFPVTIRHAR